MDNIFNIEEKCQSQSLNAKIKIGKLQRANLFGKKIAQNNCIEIK